MIGVVSFFFHCQMRHISLLCEVNASPLEIGHHYNIRASSYEDACEWYLVHTEAKVSLAFVQMVPDSH